MRPHSGDHSGVPPSPYPVHKFQPRKPRSSKGGPDFPGLNPQGDLGLRMPVLTPHSPEPGGPCVARRGWSSLEELRRHARRGRICRDQSSTLALKEDDQKKNIIIEGSGARQRTMFTGARHWEKVSVLDLLCGLPNSLLIPYIWWETTR